MSSEQESTTNTRKLDTGLTIVRILVIILAVFPILPICLIFTYGSQIPAYSDLEAVIFELGRALTLLGSICAALFLPVLIGAGILLARAAHRRVGKPYPVLLFVLIGIVWIVYVGVSIALFMMWVIGSG